MTGPGSQLFADETKMCGYAMAVAMLPAAAVESARKQMRRLLMPGQTSVHFRSESDRRRKAILETIDDQGWSCRLLVVRSKDHRFARDLCLERLVGVAAEVGAARLVLETDDSLVAADRRLLFQATRHHGIADSFAYRHHRRREEPWRWVPDAVAWCYARGGDWRRRAVPMLTDVIELP